MIRLVSQFDNEKVRTSVATPTCGGCCSSCCCCIISVIAFSTITTRNFARAIEYLSNANETSEEELKKQQSDAKFLGLFFIPSSIALVGLFFAIISASAHALICCSPIFIAAIAYMVSLKRFIIEHKNIRKRILLKSLYSLILFIIFAVLEFFAWPYDMPVLGIYIILLLMVFVYEFKKNK